MSQKILHIAPFNTSGVPITFVRAERKLGHTSRLVTLGWDRREYQEDICLDLPLLDFWGTRLVKRLVSHPSKMAVNNQAATPEKLPIEWRPNGWRERTLVDLRERLWTRHVNAFMDEINFWDFDVYQLDGGLEFFRDGRVVSQLKDRGKSVICCYTGSDLRTRGVIPAINALSDLNVTLELDHLALHPDIHHVFFPFEVSNFKPRPEIISDKIRIGHAPTNRLAKGSDKIIAAVEHLKSQFPVELDLIENISYKESLGRKAKCHIFIDQIGDLGYGLNSLESMAMGIPTCSCLVTGFAETYPEHPFIVINENNIRDRLTELITDSELRTWHAQQGRSWVERFHAGTSVVNRIHELAGLRNVDREASESTLPE